MFSPLILLAKSALKLRSNVGEKRGDTARPVSLQVEERKHPVITTLLLMIVAVTRRQNDGEERTRRGHDHRLVNRRGQKSCVPRELFRVDHMRLLSSLGYNLSVFFMSAPSFSSSSSHLPLQNQSHE